MSTLFYQLLLCVLWITLCFLNLSLNQTMRSTLSTSSLPLLDKAKEIYYWLNDKYTIGLTVVACILTLLAPEVMHHRLTTWIRSAKEGIRSAKEGIRSVRNRLS